VKVRYWPKADIPSCTKDAYRGPVQAPTKLQLVKKPRRRSASLCRVGPRATDERIDWDCRVRFYLRGACPGTLPVSVCFSSTYSTGFPRGNVTSTPIFHCPRIAALKDLIEQTLGGLRCGCHRELFANLSRVVRDNNDLMAPHLDLC